MAAASAALWLVAGFVEITLRFTMSGLVRRNLLRLVLARSGAVALPFSIGETISRFRDDAYEAEDNMDWSDEIISQGLFALVAFLVLVPATSALGTELGELLERGRGASYSAEQVITIAHTASEFDSDRFT